MFVSLILVPLFLAILQLGFALYVRNTLAACAQDGARYAADEDIVLQGASAMADAATQRAAICVTQSLPGSFAQGIAASAPNITDADGEPVSVVEVRISSPYPLVGLFGAGPHVLHVKGDALQERP